MDLEELKVCVLMCSSNIGGGAELGGGWSIHTAGCSTVSSFIRLIGIPGELITQYVLLFFS